MLNNNKVDLVEQALSHMSAFIAAKSQGLLTDELIRELLLCVSELRRGCDEQQEKEYWDRWLDEGQGNLPAKLFERIKSEGLLYLKKDNRLLCGQEKELHQLVFDDAEFGDLD